MEPSVVNPPTEPRRLWPILLLIIGLLVVGILGFALVNRQTRSLMSGFVSDPALNLDSSSGRTNIVLLGLGGKGHEAPDLTDSIIVASLNHETSSITLISLPRDIWIDSMKAKINTAYHYGNEKRDGGGIDLSKSAVSEVLGFPIHYALALDFAGFIQAIDAVGGIQVQVERTFDDFEYPIPGQENAEPESARYEHLHFDAGPTHMDGTTALKFARSRHAEGEEGTDFARAARQQKIILAFKDKLFETKTFLNRETMANVFMSLESSIDSDFEQDDYGSLLKFFLSFQQQGEQINSLNLDNLLVNPPSKAPYLGQWVLVPAANWDTIHTYVQENLR